MLTLCAIKSLFLNFKRPKIVFSEIVHKRTHQLKPGLNTKDTYTNFEYYECVKDFLLGINIQFLNIIQRITIIHTVQFQRNTLSNPKMIFLSRLCFVKLKLLLLAVEVRPDDGGDTKISINPRGSKIPANTVGFFIAQSAEEVKRFLHKCWFLFCIFCVPGPGTIARHVTRM